MRVLIFGSRTFDDRESLYRIMDDHDRNKKISVVIEGEAPGADTLGREWAKARGIKVEKFPADWERYGKAAGPIRNRQMISEGKPDMAVGFVDKPLMYTKGSKNMHDQLVSTDIPVDINEAP